ncbi:hypothetical protein VNO77_00211 [Canavalia gladiata]|uniref:Uncharacterized protein n=1 Tax=Canavalia gladiata TaxID=3824 RepID=A0AAN9MTI4_CANGL
MNTHPTSFTLSLSLSLSPLILFLCCSQFFFLSHSLAAQLRCSLLRSVIFRREQKGGKMNNYYGYQEKNTCEEMRMESVICPKPRRSGLLNHSSINSYIRPLRRPFSYQFEMEEDSGVGADLLDIILPKESQVVESPPPFLCGSPPSRVSNPVIQDEQFGNGNFNPFTEASSSSSSSARGCVPMKFGHTPAAVRIEGFDCLSRDRSSCSISAVA